MHKKWICAVLALVMLLSLAVPASAEASEEEKPVYRIRSREEFLSFAESCRLDSFSFDLIVSLEKDLDLTAAEFNGVPIFCGTFLGNGHTIRGLVLRNEGSAQGLFRYLTKDASVEDLHLEGLLLAEGSGSSIGALAGKNEGQILQCSFSGTVSGKENIGGLVGINGVSGLVEACTVTGFVSGNHFVGGIAGKNSGVIRNCENKAKINTVVQQNQVAVSDITLESLTSSEASHTVTDIGGIAGNSAGVIRDCENRADVGYQHMGYNIGGIAGTQSGYITGCKNFGSVLGRKEIGGIVGQMEPSARIEYEEDTLQILERQLNSLGSIVNDTAANLQIGADGMYDQMDALIGAIYDAEEAVLNLIPDGEELPDEDSMQAAENALSSSFADMTDILRDMDAVTESFTGALSNNLYDMESQINAMRSTLGNAQETLGGSITDVSDEDTEEDLNGKVANCINYGEVRADLNVGGIAGAMAVENDLDHEENVSVIGGNSLNFSSELRCVLTDCRNESNVTAGKQNAGGIAGWQSMGLVKNCFNSGSVDAAEYAGGVAGQSEGYIRMSAAKCTVSGSNYAGGIAGSAVIATDCVSMAQITDGVECVGAVLGSRKEGYQDEEMPVSGNCYLPVGKDPGAIDGISYTTVAEPMALADFLAKENLPEEFRTVNICFRYEEGSESSFCIASGKAFPKGKIPALPEREGFTGRWAGLEEADLSCVVFDLTFEAEHTAFDGVLSSGGDEGKPLLLVQGGFTSDSELVLKDWTGEIPLKKGQTLLKAKGFEVTPAAHLTKLRYCIYDWEGERQILLIRGLDGTWRQADSALDGSYLVAELLEGDNAVAQVQEADVPWTTIAVGAGVLIVLMVLLLKKKRK